MFWQSKENSVEQSCEDALMVYKVKDYRHAAALVVCSSWRGQASGVTGDSRALACRHPLYHVSRGFVSGRSSVRMRYGPHARRLRSSESTATTFTGGCRGGSGACTCGHHCRSLIERGGSLSWRSVRTPAHTTSQVHGAAAASSVGGHTRSKALQGPMRTGAMESYRRRFRGLSLP